MPVTSVARLYYVDTTAVILSTGVLGITQEAREPWNTTTIITQVHPLAICNVAEEVRQQPVDRHPALAMSFDMAAAAVRPDSPTQPAITSPSVRFV